MEIPTIDPVTTITCITLDFYDNVDSIRISSNNIAIIYGLSTGGVGCVQVFNSGEFTYLWLIEDDSLKRNLVTCLNAYDIDSDGKMEVIVGRDDGRYILYIICVLYRIYIRYVIIYI